MKFVVQAVPIDKETEGGPLKYKAKLRPELEYSEFEPGVPEGWDGPTGEFVLQIEARYSTSLLSKLIFRRV